MEDDSSGGKIKVRSQKSGRLISDNRQAIKVAISRGISDALMQHKRAGNTVAVWRGGQVVLLQPEEILIETKDSK